MRADRSAFTTADARPAAADGADTDAHVPDAPALDTHALSWPERFTKRHGRAPRVLHLGNVANYAYVNAKLMRARGVDAEVFDPDFFHIMATPEWVEARVEGDHGDDFKPDWTAVNLNGYRAPEWFLQTPMTMGLNYLALPRRSWEARSLKLAIDAHRRTVGATSGVAGQVQTLSGAQSPIMRRLKRGVGEAMRLWARMRGEAPLPPIAPVDPEHVGPSAPGINMLQDSFRRAFARYDIVQGYTVSGAYPLAAGVKNTVAYELGTLRGLPFEDTAMGRLCAWTYRNAAATFVTNVDCVASAHRLGVPEERIHPMLHAFDLERAIEGAADPKAERHRAEHPFFFAPARHHWQTGNASWLKGNDVYLRAAGLLARRGYAFRLVLVEWGEELAESRALITEEGLSDRVDWIRPLCRARLWPYYLGAAAVIDQFKAPAFGGVALEALALGRPLISAFDGEASRLFFRTEPALFNVKEPEAVADAMARVLDDPEAAARMGRAGQEWMKAEHSVPRQLGTQFAVYERLIEANGPAAR